MKWPEKEQVLLRLGHGGFESEDHFQEWLQYECPVIDEKRIKKAFADYEQNTFYPHYSTHTGAGSIHKGKLLTEVG